MPYGIVRKFEQTIAEYAGSRYAIAVESCTAALFLSCKYAFDNNDITRRTVKIPKHTYPGVACSIINAGGKVNFTNETWDGIYEIKPHGIIDGALRFKRGMYTGWMHCLSFHIKKHLPIGRGGMILTDDRKADEWLRCARFDGRHECALKHDNIEIVGYNMYMTPEQAARGLMLFDVLKGRDLPDLKTEDQGYPDLSQIKAYK